MFKRASILIHAVFLLAICPSVSGSPLAEEQALRIAVTDVVGGRLAGATVLLLSTDRVVQATADMNGGLQFNNVAPGIYQVQASSPGFAKKIIEGVAVPQTESKPIEITLRVGDQWDQCGFVNTVDYPSLRAGAALSGRVVDADRHNALAKTTVSLFATGSDRRVDSTQSGTDGRFTFATVQPGRYSLHVSKHGYIPGWLKEFFVSRENSTVLTVTLGRTGHMHVCQ